MKNETIRYFPFAEGVPYFIRNGRYIIPRLDADNWKRAFAGKAAVLSLDGGFIENIFALSFFEALSHMCPAQKLEWCGNPFYKEACEFQGLAKPTDRISSDDLRRYPVCLLRWERPPPADPVPYSARGAHQIFLLFSLIIDKRFLPL